MQKELYRVRKALLSLNKPDNNAVKGIIFDYLPDRRSLKKDLITAAELGIISGMLHKPKIKGFWLPLKIKRLGQSIPNEAKRSELIKICKFITGKSKRCSCGNYGALPDGKQESAPTAIHTVTKTINIRLARGFAAIPAFNLSWLPAGKYVLRGIMVLVLAMGVIALFKRPRRILAMPRTPTPVTAVYHPVIKANVQGHYLGKITKSGILRKYALFVKQHNADTLLCTFIDYPYFHYPKVSFVAGKIKGNRYQTKFGDLIISNDTIRFDNKITRDNLQIGIFVKRTN